MLYHQLYDVRLLGRRLGDTSLIKDSLKLDSLLGNNPMYSTVKFVGVFFKFKDTPETKIIYEHKKFKELTIPESINICFSYMAGENVASFNLMYDRKQNYKVKIVQGKLSMEVDKYVALIKQNKIHSQVVNFLRGFLYRESEHITLCEGEFSERERIKVMVADMDVDTREGYGDNDTNEVLQEVVEGNYYEQGL